MKLNGSRNSFFGNSTTNEARGIIQELDDANEEAKLSCKDANKQLKQTDKLIKDANLLHQEVKATTEPFRLK